MKHEGVGDAGMFAETFPNFPHSGDVNVSVKLNVIRSSASTSTLLYDFEHEKYDLNLKNVVRRI
jgi:hypothetical protein